MIRLAMPVSLSCVRLPLLLLKEPAVGFRFAG